VYDEAAARLAALELKNFARATKQLQHGQRPGQKKKKASGKATTKTKAVTPTAIPIIVNTEGPGVVVVPAPEASPPGDCGEAVMTAAAAAVEEVMEVRDRVGVGDKEGVIITTGTATAAFTRSLGLENPREEAMPDCCTARIREPSVSLLATSAFIVACNAAALLVLLLVLSWRARKVEEVTVKDSCQPAKMEDVS
jgi:hypothetical protein